MKKLLLLSVCMLIAIGAFAQMKVSGTVVDELDQPMPGVTVREVGTTNGTNTNLDGQFNLSVQEGAQLQFSFVGYKPQTVAATAGAINIKMEPDITTLGEVVVVGYGTSTKKEATGAVSVVEAQKIEALNPQRVDQALQGQVAGVNISAASGSPGGGFNIRIRGITTNGNNNPLILVDGVRYDAAGLNALNPTDIESINVLKDATAGIYGVQAANGVILITTKKGLSGQAPRFEFSGFYGIQETTNRLNMLNAREYAILKNEAFAAGGQAPPFNNVELGEGTDWQDQVFDRAPIQNYNLNVSGSSGKTRYSIGGSYLDQEGIVGGPKASFQRYTARLNFVTELTTDVTLENVLLYTNEQRTTLPEFGIGSVLFNAVNAYPNEPVRNEDGTFSSLDLVNDIINPVAQIENEFNQNITNKLVGKQEIGWQINDDFKVTARAGYNYAIYDGKFFAPLVYYGAGKAQNTALNPALDPVQVEIAPGTSVPRLSSVTETRQTFLDYNLEGFVNYNKTFGIDHTVKGTLGFSFFGVRNQGVTGTGFDIPFNSFEFADLAAADPNNLLNNSGSFQFRNRLQSVFMRGEYSYKQKYLASFILRRDGSSNFGPNNRYGVFPSFSAGWVISDENFFDNSGLNAINFAKLRASYGVTGNDRIPVFAYRAQLGGEGVYVFNDQLANGIAIGRLGNPDLKWETTEQANIGLNLTLFDGLFNVDLDYYVKTTRDLLFAPDVSGVLGAYGAGSFPPFINAGDVRNTGLDLAIIFENSTKSGLNYGFTYNLTTINNEVTALPAGLDFLEGGAFGVGGGLATRLEVGQPIGYFFGFRTEGVYQTEEEVNNRGVVQNQATAGDLIFADTDGDGVVEFGNDEDKVFLGSPIPEVTMGMAFNADYKGFDFSAFVYASIGNEVVRNFERQQPFANLLNYRIQRWTGPGSTNEHPKLTTAANNNAVFSDYFVEDGSFLRLRNIQLGYSLPESLIERLGITKLRVYVAANNLITLTRYTGFDPDFASPDPLSAGIDNGFYPAAKSYMVGLNLNF